VHPRERALELRVLQVGEEAARLRGHEHALPHARPRAERRGVEVRAGGELDDATDDVELALERILVVLEAGPCLDEHVPHVRARAVGGGADELLVDRHVAPAEDALALDAHVELDHLLELLPARRVLRQEADADAVAAGLGELEVDDLAEELVRDLDQHPGAVAGQRIGARGTAVLEVLEGPQAHLDDLVGRPVVETGDERDTTCVVLVAGVVEAAGLQGRFEHDGSAVERASGTEAERRW
jgi:hypothetical protein